MAKERSVGLGVSHTGRLEGSVWTLTFKLNVSIMPREQLLADP